MPESSQEIASLVNSPSAFWELTELIKRELGYRMKVSDNKSFQRDTGHQLKSEVVKTSRILNSTWDPNCGISELTETVSLRFFRSLKRNPPLLILSEFQLHMQLAPRNVLAFHLSVLILAFSSFSDISPNENRPSWLTSKFALSEVQWQKNMKTFQPSYQTFSSFPPHWATFSSEERVMQTKMHTYLRGKHTQRIACREKNHQICFYFHFQWHTCTRTKYHT